MPQSATTSATVVLTVAIIAAFASISASIISALVSRSNTNRTIKTQVTLNSQTLGHQRALDRDNDERALRDARAQRLRNHFVLAIEAAYRLSSILMVPATPETGLTKERRKEFEDEWNTAATSFDAIKVVLEIETGSETIMKAIRTVTRSFQGYRTMRDANALGPPPLEFNLDALREQRKQFNDAVDDLVRVLRDHLAQLDQPLPDTPPTPQPDPYPGRLALLKRVFTGR